MDKRFGDWMRDALADIDDGVLKRRWGGVEALAGKLKQDEVLELVLYSSGCGTQDDATLQKVRRIFWEHDNAFRMEGNDLELRRLCGTIVIHVLHGKSDRRLNAALTCICLQFGGSLDENTWPALLEEAETTIQDMSAGVRSNDMLNQNAGRNILPSKVLGRMKELIDEGHDHIPLQDLNSLVSQFAKVINQLGSNYSTLKSALALQREENNILWWLVGGYSNDLERSFDGMSGAVAGTIAGKELADHVIHLPGPLSVGSILHRVITRTIHNDLPVTLESLVPELPMHWRQTLVAEGFDAVLRYCPLMSAIAYSVAVEDDASWVTPFSKQFPHSTKLEIPPALLAYQMYRERMLLRSLS